jgi:acyl carrier protein
MIDESRLEQVFRRGLNLEDGVDVRSLAYAKHPNWDSVGHMALVAELEDEYDLMLETDDVLNLSDWNAAVETLSRLGAAA